MKANSSYCFLAVFIWGNCISLGLWICLRDLLARWAFESHLICCFDCSAYSRGVCTGWGSSPLLLLCGCCSGLVSSLWLYSAFRQCFSDFTFFFFSCDCSWFHQLKCRCYLLGMLRCEHHQLCLPRCFFYRRGEERCCFEQSRNWQGWTVSEKQWNFSKFEVESSVWLLSIPLDTRVFLLITRQS